MVKFRVNLVIRCSRVDIERSLTPRQGAPGEPAGSRSSPSSFHLRPRKVFLEKYCKALPTFTWDVIDLTPGVYLEEKALILKPKKGV